MGTFEEIIRYVGIFGLGAILGILIKHFLDKDRERGSRVFNAKKRILCCSCKCNFGF